MTSKATETMVKLINDLCGCDAVSVGEDNIYVDDMSNEGGYFIECEDDDEVYNTLMSMHDGMTLLNGIKNQSKAMKSAEQIRAEITEIDKAIDEKIAEYNRGTLPEEAFHEVRTRLTSAKNTLLWVLKSESEPTVNDVEVWTEYSESADMTFIMEGTNDGKTSSISVVGFYFGKPDAESTEYFRGKTTATCEL